MLGIKPGAAGSGSKYAKLCAMVLPCYQLYVDVHYLFYRKLVCRWHPSSLQVQLMFVLCSLSVFSYTMLEWAELNGSASYPLTLCVSTGSVDREN